MAQEDEELALFFGTDEEKTIKDIFNSLCAPTPLLPNYLNFINHVIVTCNVLKATRFTSADITLGIHKELNENKTNLHFGVRPKRECSSYIGFEQMFNFDIFNNVSTLGLAAVPADCQGAFAALLNFMHRKLIHRGSYYLMLTGIEKETSSIKEITERSQKDKATVAAVLVKHLLSQLIPGQNYVIQGAKDKLAFCPCNCKAKLQFGNTSVGNTSTWHGFVDIFLNQSIAVSVLDLPIDQCDSEIQSDTEESKTCSGNYEPEIKKKKVEGAEEEDKLEASLCVQAKNKLYKTDTKSILFQSETLDQIIAETITNGFAQVNLNKKLSGWLIPTIGCTRESALVFLYDPKSDILLQSRLIPLWKGPVLNISGVI